MLRYKLLLAVNYFTQVLQFMVLAYVILSWFARPGGKSYRYYRALGELLEPLFSPFRRLTRGFALRTGLDFTPFFTVIALSLFYQLIHRILSAGL